MWLLPKGVDAAETVLRALKQKDMTGNSVKAATLKPPAKDPFQISVIRQRVGDTCAKRAAKKYVYKNSSEFGGFGRIRVADLIELDLAVMDDRIYFRGHANLQFNFELPRGAPFSPATASPELAEGWAKILELADRFELVRDDRPSSFRWTGPALKIA